MCKFFDMCMRFNMLLNKCACVLISNYINMDMCINICMNFNVQVY